MSQNDGRLSIDDSRSKRKHLVVSSALVSFCRLLVILGEFVALILIGTRFGARVETDAYLAARFVPVGLVSALAGAFSLTFIPVYSKTCTELGEAVGTHLAGEIVNVIQLASVLVTLCYVAAADWVVALLTPGLPLEGQHLAASLTRIMAVCFLLGNLYTTLDGVLNAHHRYVASAFASLWMPIGTLVGVLVLARFWGIYGVAFGVLGGAVLRLGTVLPATRHLVPWRVLGMRLGAGRLRETLSAFGVALLIFGAAHVNAWIPRMFASWLGQGAIAVFTFGILPVLVLPSLLALSIHKVLYPEIVQLMADNNHQRLSDSYCRGVGIVAFIAFPITAGLLVLSPSITRLVFQYGQFDATASLQMADVMAWTSLSLFPSVAGMMLSGYLFARGRTGLILSLTLLMMVLIAVLDYAMMTWMGLAGLGLATALVSLVRFGLLVMAVRWFSPEINLGPTAWPVFKVAIAAVVTGATLSWADQWLRHIVGLRTPQEQLLNLMLLIIVGAGLYLVMNLLLRNRQPLAVLATLVGEISRQSRNH